MGAKAASVLFAMALIVAFISTPLSSAKDASSGSGNIHQLPLEDLHDAGFVLKLIGQQAVAIHAEATRLKTAPPGSVESLSAISDQPLRSDPEYKPLRKAWIVFFIGTMEPLVHLLDDALKDALSGAYEMKVPAEKKASLDHMMKDISGSVGEINKHLNKCADVLNNADVSNTLIAREAAAIASETLKAEQVRAQEVKLFGNLGEPGTYAIKRDHATK
jgi:hypothetical protein